MNRKFALNLLRGILKIPLNLFKDLVNLCAMLRPYRKQLSLGLIILLLAYVFTGPFRSTIIRKNPYLIYPGTNTQMTLLWQLQKSVDHCHLMLGTDTTYSLLDVSVTEFNAEHQYEYTFQNLQPETTYFYKLILQDEQLESSFMTAPNEDTESVNFFVYGDTRKNYFDHNRVNAGILKLIEKEPEFQTLCLFTGDYVQDGRKESSWDREFFNPYCKATAALRMRVPTNGVIGNHEFEGDLYHKYFPYPYVEPFYWSFDYGPVRFIMMDQYVSKYDTGSEQLNWIDQQLRESPKTWNIIILHAPGYSAGGNHIDITNVKKYIQPLCERYGVELVFSAHNHYYARAEVNGVIHITTGGAGAPLYTPDPTYSNYIQDYEKTHHFCTIRISGDTLTCTAVRPDLSEIESFTVSKATPEKPEPIQ